MTSLRRFALTTVKPVIILAACAMSISTAAQTALPATPPTVSPTNQVVPPASALGSEMLNPTAVTGAAPVIAELPTAPSQAITLPTEGKILPATQEVTNPSAATPPAVPQAPPPSPAASSANNAADQPADLFKTVFGLIFVMGLMIGAIWLMRRLGVVKPLNRSIVKVVGGTAVGNRERVVVVEIGDQWIVLGVAPGRVSGITQMQRQENIDVQIDGTPASAGFSEWLRQNVARRNITH